MEACYSELFLHTCIFVVLVTNTYLYEIEKFQAYVDEVFDKAIPGSTHQVHNSNCALIDFLFSSISMRFLKTNSVSTVTGKGLK